MTTNSHTLMGTAGGTILSMLPNLHSADVLKTVLLAAIGAVVSFTISLILKKIINKHLK
jgi:mannitol-specific phosphotransferase system IIBC component